MLCQGVVEWSVLLFVASLDIATAFEDVRLQEVVSSYRCRDVPIRLIVAMVRESVCFSIQRILAGAQARTSILFAKVVSREGREFPLLGNRCCHLESRRSSTSGRKRVSM